MNKSETKLNILLRQKNNNPADFEDKNTKLKTNSENDICI